MLIFRATKIISGAEMEMTKDTLKAVFGKDCIVLPSYLEFCGEVVTETRRDEEGEKE